MKKLTRDQRVRLIELEQPDGSITPEVVVADASNPDSPLHGHFEWNDSKAAHQHRLQQARAILRVRFVVTNEETVLRVPYYVHDATAPPKEQRYVSVLTLRTNHQSAVETTRLEIAKAEGALLRAKSVAAILGTAALFEDLLVRLERMKLAVLTTPGADDNGDGDSQQH